MRRRSASEGRSRAHMSASCVAVRRGALDAPSSRASANENSRRTSAPMRRSSSAGRTGFSWCRRDDPPRRRGSLESRRDLAESRRVADSRTRRRSSTTSIASSPTEKPEVDRPHMGRAIDRMTKTLSARLSARVRLTHDHTARTSSAEHHDEASPVLARGTMSVRDQPALWVMSQSTVNEVRRAHRRRVVRPPDGRLPGQLSEALRTGHPQASTRELNLRYCVDLARLRGSPRAPARALAAR